MITTKAGRAALVNAEQNGTAPLQIVSVGITAAVFTPGDDMVGLPGEIKRLTTFSGGAVAADTIHVSVRDDGSDTYTVRGFGYWLSNGVLFAVYGQPEPILEKSVQSMMLLAADTIFTTVNVASLSFGDTNFNNPPATVDRQGVVELATVAETKSGTDATRAVTPAGLTPTIAQAITTHKAEADPHPQYQVKLGYAPVQQGTGIGQLPNIVKIGWSGAALKATVDSLDLGSFVFQKELAEGLSKYLPLTGGNVDVLTVGGVGKRAVTQGQNGTLPDGGMPIIADCNNAPLGWATYTSEATANRPSPYGQIFTSSLAGSATPDNGNWVLQRALSSDNQTYTRVNVGGGAGAWSGWSLSWGLNNFDPGSKVNGTGISLHWSGKNGQPTWLLGGEASNDVNLYNPLNFRVQSAETINNGSDYMRFSWSDPGGQTSWIWGSDGPTGARLSTTANLSVGNATNAENISNGNSYMRFSWSDPGGQTSYVWGSDGPTGARLSATANLSVGYARGAGNADTVGGVPMRHQENSDRPYYFYGRNGSTAELTLYPVSLFADRGAQVVHASGIQEFGGIDPGHNGGTVDLPSPWVVTGLRTNTSGNYITYLRGTWLRNN